MPVPLHNGIICSFMKICLINNLYKPYSKGGAERVVEIIVEELKKKALLGQYVIINRNGKACRVSAKQALKMAKTK